MTASITGVMIDSREPDWIQRLDFGNIPVLVTTLDHGDVWAVTDDGCTLLIERKTPDDFLNTLQEGRLFPQIAKLVEKRIDEQLGTGDRLTYWSYLIITGQFFCDRDGKIITEHRTTNWSYQSIQGALLTVQEMGCFVEQLYNEKDFAPAILRLGKRDRDINYRIMPPRIPDVVGPQVALLASIPGLGLDRAWDLYRESGGNLAWALEWLTDPKAGGNVKGIGNGIRKNAKAMFGLEEGMKLTVIDEKEKSK